MNPLTVYFAAWPELASTPKRKAIPLKGRDGFRLA